MAQSVKIVSNRRKNTFQLIVDGHELSGVLSYDLKESIRQVPTLNVTMEVYEVIEAQLEGQS